MSRQLFLKWLLLQAATIAFLAGMTSAYGGRVHGAALVVVPVILLEFGIGTAIGGRACWWADARSLHEAKYLNFWGWCCQVLGIMATIYGLFVLFSDGGSQAEVVSRVQGGMSVVLVPSFVGLLCSKVLAMEERLIDHELGR